MLKSNKVSPGFQVQANDVDHRILASRFFQEAK